jgi:hypothetical protein
MSEPHDDAWHVWGRLVQCDTLMGPGAGVMSRWNPAVEEQACDRIHRLGQARPVSVARFVAAVRCCVHIHHTIILLCMYVWVRGARAGLHLLVCILTHKLLVHREPSKRK